MEFRKTLTVAIPGQEVQTPRERGNKVEGKGGREKLSGVRRVGAEGEVINGRLLISCLFMTCVSSRNGVIKPSSPHTLSSAITPPASVASELPFSS